MAYVLCICVCGRSSMVLSLCLLQNFCGRVMTVESTPAHLTGGPLASTELALERVPIQGGALKKLPSAPQDLEFHSTVSVK